MSEIGTDPEPLARGKLYKIAWYFYLVLAVAGVVWIGLREGTIPLARFVDVGHIWVDLGAGVAGGFVMIAIWWVMQRLSSGARALEAQLSELLGPLDKGEIVGLALLSGFAEELFFRGAMLGSLGFFATTLLFAFVHTGPGRAYRLWTLFALLGGLVLGGLMVWRGNLLAPVVAHVVVNGVNLSRLERDVRRPD